MTQTAPEDRVSCRPNMKVVSKESSLYLSCVTFPCPSIAAAHCTSVRGGLYVCRMSPSEGKGKSDAPQSTKNENPIMKQQKSLSPWRLSNLSLRSRTPKPTMGWADRFLVQLANQAWIAECLQLLYLHAETIRRAFHIFHSDEGRSEGESLWLELSGAHRPISWPGLQWMLSRQDLPAIAACTQYIPGWAFALNPWAPR